MKRITNIVILGAGSLRCTSLAASFLTPLSAAAAPSGDDDIPDDWFHAALKSAADADKIIAQLDPRSEPVIEDRAKELLESGDNEGFIALLENVAAHLKELQDENGGAADSADVRQKLQIPLSDWILNGC